MSHRVRPRFQTAATWAAAGLVVLLVAAFLFSTVSRFERVALETGQNLYDSIVSRDQLDPELFELFLKSGVYRQFAERFLSPEQIDEVGIEAYLS